MTFKERCQVAQDCLPRAGYVVMLTELHDQMLRRIDALESGLELAKSDAMRNAKIAVNFKAERDEYRKAADDMAAAHKVERDGLMRDKEVLLGHMDTIRNCTNDPAISSLANVVLERMAQGGEK